MKVGLVLSGGGTRGIAHLGVLKALEELGVRVSVIAACSSGAIAGALYAYGYTPDDILAIIKEIRVLRIIRPALTKTGLLKMEVTESIYRRYLPENSFEQLKIPLIVTATDLQAGTIEYFSSGELIRPIMASSSIPVIFKPVRINGKCYVDGGLLNNLPVGILQQQCDKIIASHCNPIDEHFELTNIKSMVERTFLLIINANAQQEIGLCDLVIEPPGLKRHKVFAFSKADEIFQIGYEYTLQMSEKLQAFRHNTL